MAGGGGGVLGIVLAGVGGAQGGFFFAGCVWWALVLTVGCPEGGFLGGGVWREATCRQEPRPYCSYKIGG